MAKRMFHPLTAGGYCSAISGLFTVVTQRAFPAASAANSGIAHDMVDGATS
jgi:hypothetical protein